MGPTLLVRGVVKVVVGATAGEEDESWMKPRLSNSKIPRIGDPISVVGHSVGAKWQSSFRSGSTSSKAEGASVRFYPGGQLTQARALRARR
mmetsp:Transcript_23231/g.63851  ORF Transcript_23231/g.63851 Transcript_23231/m.63851 type:complete len:91 (+) Transcript_23231:1000-1272(+)